MSCRVAPIFMFSLVLSGCSYTYEIEVKAEAGSIVFEPRSDKGTGCLSEFTVMNENGTVMWRVSKDEYLLPPCSDKFPVTYGSIPSGMTEEIDAAPLKEETTYEVEAWDGDSYSGTFRFRQGIVVENL